MAPKKPRIKMQKSSHAAIMKKVKAKEALKIGATAGTMKGIRSDLERKGYKMVLFAQTDNMKKAMERLFDAGGGRDNQTNRSHHSEARGFIYACINPSFRYCYNDNEDDDY